MSGYNSLIKYDKCLYDMDNESSKKPLEYFLYSGKYENKTKCNCLESQKKSNYLMNSNLHCIPSSNQLSCPQLCSSCSSCSSCN